MAGIPTQSVTTPMTSPRIWASSGSSRSGQSTPCPQPGEARYQPYQNRMSTVDQSAAEAAALRIKQGLVRADITKCVKILRPYCGACLVATGDFYNDHLVGAGCRLAQNVAHYIPFGNGWQEFRNDCQIKTGPIKFCYGCLLPIGKHKIMAHDNAGAQCEDRNKIAQVGFAVWETLDTHILMIDEFFGGNQDLTKGEFVQWCRQTDDLYFTNLIRLFVWVCLLKGM